MKFGLADALDFLTKLIQIPSVEGAEEEGKPFGNDVAAALNYCLETMSSLGYDVHNMDNYCGYGTIGEGEKFDILMHVDVVPAGSGWNIEPFSGTLKRGNLYGRGALDNKGPIASILYAVNRLLDEGLTPKKQIRIILGCDEESGWKCMEHFQKSEEFADCGFSPDGDFPVINCEKGIVYHTLSLPLPDGLKELSGGERANVIPDKATAVLSDGKIIQGIGVSGHGSHPERGENAIVNLLGKLKKDFPSLAKIYDCFASYNGTGVGLRLFDAESGSLTLNLGTVKTIEDRIVFELDIRYPVTYDMDTITETLVQNCDCEVERYFYHKPLYLRPDNPLVTTLLSAYTKVTGDKAKPISVGGGTYARVLKQGCAFGPIFPGEEGGIHCADEHISISSFNTMSDIYYEAIKALCF